MKTYKVTITETLKMSVDIEANSRLDAEEKVKIAWENGEYILDADNFMGAEFKAKLDKEMER